MPSKETETILQDTATVTNVKDARGRWVQKAKRYLTRQEREEREGHINRMKHQLRQPAWVNDALGGTSPATLARGIRAMEDELEDHSPPKVSGETRDALAKRKKVLQEQLKSGLLSHEEMRRNPPGAVDRHRKWEKANKERILEYKNICRTLEPDSDAKDLASIEVLRPHTQRTLTSNAQIGGHMAYTDVPQENWDRTFGKKPQPEKEDDIFSSPPEKDDNFDIFRND